MRKSESGNKALAGHANKTTKISSRPASLVKINRKTTTTAKEREGKREGKGKDRKWGTGQEDMR